MRDHSRDKCMAILRQAAAVDHPVSIEDVPKSSGTRAKYMAADTADAKLDVFRNHQIVECRNALKELQKQECADPWTIVAD